MLMFKWSTHFRYSTTIAQGLLWKRKKKKHSLRPRDGRRVQGKYVFQT